MRPSVSRPVRVLRAATLAAMLAAMLAACGGGATDVPSTSSTEPLRFQVSNALIAPVVVRVDGDPLVILSAGASSGVGVRRSAQWLTWTSAKPTDSTGRPIPDDIGEVRVRVAGVGPAFEISNVIDGMPHVTVGVVNRSDKPAEIGVFDGAKVACAGALPVTGRDGQRGFVQTGYYRLSSDTELRAYRYGSGCTGSYVAWPRTALAGFTAKAGALSLSLDTAP
jgi:hypothetical protein